MKYLQARPAQCAFFCFLAMFSVYLSLSKEHRAPVPDGYVRYAYVLSEHGRYGVVSGTASRDLTEPKAGIGRAPLYPLFLAAAMQISPSYKTMAACYIRDLDNCDWSDARVVHLLQLILMAGALYLLLSSAMMLGAPAWAAALSAAVAAPGLLKLIYEWRLSEGLALPLFALVAYGLTSWFTGRGRYSSLAVAAAGLGLLALTRGAFVYFIPILAIAVFALPTRSCNDAPQLLQRRALGATVFLALSLTIITPWCLRNLIYFDRFTIGEAGVEGVLTMRVQYNRMTAAEAGAAMLIWAPKPLPQVAAALYSDKTIDRFRFDKPTSFRQQGWDYLANLKSHIPDHRLRKRILLKKMLFADPLRHVLVSVPMMFRGMYHVWIFLPFALVGMVHLIARRHWWAIGVAALTVLTIVFHAGLTHFRARYGLPLIFGIAPFAACGLAIIARHYLNRRANEHA